MVHHSKPTKHADFKKNDKLAPGHKKDNQAIRLLLSGAITGCTTKSFTAPLERIKIIQQLSTMNTHGGGSPGVFRTGCNIMTQEGFVAFWRGNGANCIRVMPVYGLKFGLNDKIKDTFRSTPTSQLSRSEQFAAGTSAGSITAILTYPLDLVRTRLSLSAGVEYKGSLNYPQSPQK
jgi:solute carrier family 25 (mitochondrial phosphate transporter), member 23/24/25/41